MRVGVTGASGYVGRALVRRLAGRHDTIVLLREGSTPSFGVPVHEVRGDIRDPDAVRSLAEASDAVIHAAAYVHRAAATGRERAECFGINDSGTRTLVAALEATGRRPHLVFVSTTAVYGDRVHGAIEGAVPHPVTEYGKSKLLAEQYVMDAARRNAITACVVRPAVVYGIGAPGNVARLLATIQRGWLPRVGGARNRKSMVHVDDLAEAIVRAAERPDRTNGRTYNVAGEAVTVDTMAHALAKGAAARVRWIPVPRMVASLAAGTSRVLSLASGGRLPDASRALDAFAGEATVDAAAVAADLGVSFRPAALGLEDTAREWVRLGQSPAATGWVG